MPIVNNMVELAESGLDSAFAALGDGTRRAILARLMRQDGGLTVSEVALPIAMSLNGVSKHLRVLERAGLVRREVRGRTHHLFAVPEALDGAAAWISEQRAFWEARFDALEEYLMENGEMGGSFG